MFKKFKSDKIDYENVNETFSLFNRILKILFFVLIICGVFVVSYILKQWRVFAILKTFLKVLTPFFIGFIIAWLLNPLVKFLCKHKFSRPVASIFVYVVFLLLLSLVLIYTVPTVTGQINEFINVFPKLTNNLREIVDKVCEVFSPILNNDVDTIKVQIMSSVTDFAKNLTVEVPDKVISLFGAIVSGFGTALMGLFIGLYLLIDFDNVSKTIINFMPVSWREDAKNLMEIANQTLVNYIQGLMLTTTLIWFENSIGFTIAGLKAGLLLAFFCGITNIIPYVGPYIGGIPAVLIGFSQGIGTGVLTLMSVLIAQLLDNVIFTPLVQSKNLKLHPVTIIISLLVFGHFFGIVGMIVAAPLIAMVKVIFHYFNDKYDLITLKVEEEVENNE